MARASLKRHFQWWLGAGTMSCLLLAVGVQGWLGGRELARAQDARLLEALGRESVASGLAWRRSRTSGERLAGDSALPPYPWPDELRIGAPPRLYYTHVGGDIARAAVMLSPGADGDLTVVQVAQPASARIPAWATWTSGFLPAFAAGLFAMAACAWLAAASARRWIAQAVSDPAAPSAARRPPEELAAMLEGVFELKRQQQAWVDEQRRFLADAAHQLRTPLAVLRTQLQSALQSDDPADPVLGDMLHTVDRASGLADQLLSLTRIEQLKRAGQLQRLPIRGIAHDAVVELSPLLARKRLDFALEGDDFEATADAVMLGELIRNLLANAIHHCPTGGKVGVVLRTSPDLQVIVWDEGEGIADAVRPRLFTPFSAARGGVGLGLSICRQIAAAMGAQVRLHNRVEAGRTAGVDAVITWGQTP